MNEKHLELIRKAREVFHENRKAYAAQRIADLKHDKECERMVFLRLSAGRAR